MSAQGSGTPKVSVTVVTYNHGEWLAECLESIVTQKTDFPFEVIVGDDASTDGRTTDVLNDYAKKFPHIIVPVYRKTNVGPVPNLFDVVRRAKGEYIAHLDGDDIMLPGKLQGQADFLDMNPQFVMSTHRMALLSGKILTMPMENNAYPEVGTVNDLLRLGCYFCHSSKMYRRSAIITRESMLPIVDYFLHIEHAISGKIHFDTNVFGGHRLHAQGMSASAQFKKYIQEAYERAYDRAIELGVAIAVVELGRIRHHQAMALSMLADGSLASFQQILEGDSPRMVYASAKQKMIYFVAKYPSMAYRLYSFWKKISGFYKHIISLLFHS